MTDMNIDHSKFERYAELKRVIKDAEKELEPLNEWIAHEMEEAKVDDIQTEYGEFYFTTRSKWKYPEDITQAEADLKAKKKEAEQKGYAEREEQKILTYKQKTTE